MVRLKFFTFFLVYYTIYLASVLAKELTKSLSPRNANFRTYSYNIVEYRLKKITFRNGNVDIDDFMVCFVL